MKIHGLTVSVGYAAELAQSLDLWLPGLESLTVVTSPADAATHALCLGRDKVTVYATNAFYRDGALFNKGRAMSEAVDRLHLCEADWFLAFDADVEPAKNWKVAIETQAKRVDQLYGARRIDYLTKRRVPDGELAGYFMLFHSSDPVAQERPLFPTQYYHAANYDSDFVRRWPEHKQYILDLELIHYGVPGQNWCGVGNDAAMAQLRVARAAGRKWRTETIHAPVNPDSDHPLPETSIRPPNAGAGYTANAGD